MTAVEARGKRLERSMLELAKVKWSPAPPILRQRDTYVMPAFAGDWNRLIAEARRQSTSARKGLAQVRPIQTRVRSLAERAESFTTEVQAAWRPLQDRPDWALVRAEALKRVRETMTLREAETMVDTWGALSGSAMTRGVLGPLDDVASHLEETTASWHAALMGAELAQATAAFNLRVRSTLPTSAALTRWLRREAATLESREEAIWQALRQGDDQRVSVLADGLRKWASGETLAAATRTAAGLARARLTAQNRWDLGPAALATAELIRGLLMGQALSLRVGRLDREGLGASRAWREAAAGLSFGTNWQPPATTRLSELWTQGAAYDRRVVTVEGLVGPVTNRHVRNKVYSSAWLSDRSGQMLRVGILHIKLDSAGFVEGAYARVTGRFALADAEFGTPLVRVGRRSLVEDSRHSWQDWTTLQLRRIFTSVPHALMASWSWEPGVVGANNQLRYGTWLPFRRETSNG